MAHSFRGFSLQSTSSVSFGPVARQKIMVAGQGRAARKKRWWQVYERSP